MYPCSGKGLEAAQSQLTPTLPLILLDGSMDGHAQCSACRAEGPSAHCLARYRHRQFITTAYPPIHLSHRRPISNAMSCWNLDDRSPALPFPFTSLPVPRWSMDGLPVCDWGCFGIELHALESDCTSPLTRGSFFSSRTMSIQYRIIPCLNRLSIPYQICATW